MIEMEKQVITSFLLGNNLEYTNYLEPNEFQFFPKTMESIKEQYTLEGAISILEVSKKSEFKLKELAEMMKDCFPILFKDYYRQLKEVSVKQRLKSTIQTVEGIDSNFKKNISSLINEIESISADLSEENTDMYIEYIKELDIRANNKTQINIGIPKIDSVTGGLKKQEFTVVAARTGVGKSALALQIAENVSNDTKVLFISLEMSKNQIIDRLIFKHSSIEQYRIKSGNLKLDDWEQLRNTMEGLPKNIIMLEKTTTLQGVRNAVERHAPDLLIIDHIGLLKGGKFNSKREETVHITNTLKLMTTEYNISIIGLAQINRNGDGRIPTLADLKESGSIEEDANNIIVIHNAAREDGIFLAGDFDRIEANNGTPVLIMLAKNRQGETVAVKSIYIKNKLTFREVTK